MSAVSSDGLVTQTAVRGCPRGERRRGKETVRGMETGYAPDQERTCASTHLCQLEDTEEGCFQSHGKKGDDQRQGIDETQFVAIDCQSCAFACGTMDQESSKMKQSNAHIPPIFSFCFFSLHLAYSFSSSSSSHSISLSLSPLSID